MDNLIPFLSYVFVVTFTPGPNNIMSMVNANKFGYKNTLRFMSGVFLGFVMIMLLCSYFNLFLYNIMPKIQILMSILGALFMTYLALKIMFSSSSTQQKKEKRLNSFSTGVAMQFVNIKVILYGITVISNFIIPYYKSNIALFLFSIFLAFVALVSTSCWALFGVFLQKFLTKYEKPFNMAMGLLLIYSAISIAGIF